MSKPTIIYLSGFRRHAGKTTTSLGLLSLLRRHMDPAEIGYIKPVGQELSQLPDGCWVDKDAVIVRAFGGIPDFQIENTSPVRIGSGFTKRFLSSEDHAAESDRLRASITQAFESMKHKRVIIAEGTGHPGVGGVVGLSNADVSTMVGADIIYLSGGGIGKALDMLEVDLSYFRYKGARLRGLIFNKVISEKLDMVSKHLTEGLINRMFPFDRTVRIFGYLPEIEILSKPSMSLIARCFTSGRPIGDPTNALWNVPCHNIRIISQTSEYLRPESYLEPHDIVLVGAASQSRKTRILSYNRTLARVGSMLGGIILTCGRTTPLDPLIEDEIAASGVPALYVQEDTATAEEKLLSCFEDTKLQLYDSDKTRQIERMFEQHFDMDKFVSTFGLT